MEECKYLLASQRLIGEPRILFLSIKLSLYLIIHQFVLPVPASSRSLTNLRETQKVSRVIKIGSLSLRYFPVAI